MHDTVKNLIDIKNNINKYNINNNPTIIAVSKTFRIENIKPLIDFGHVDFGENKVQEAAKKWIEIKKNIPKIKLHMIGKLQTNKVKLAVSIFDYIHSVDSEKLAKKIYNEQSKIQKNIKIFLQVNIGNENQKSGIEKKKIEELVFYCKKINLEIIGLMCIPPVNNNPEIYFQEMNELNKHLGFSQLSMGMSADYLEATKFGSSFVRVGSKIFGPRA
jgi:pyridoxal phosphate enzyme (YggS family)